MIGLTNRDSPLTRSLVGSVAPYYATHAMASHVNPANLSEEIYYSKIIANVTWSEFLRNNYTPGVTQPTSITVANKLYPVGNTYTVQVNAGGNSLHLSALLFDLVNGDPSNGGINEEGSATREWVGDPSNGIPGVSLNAVEESDASGPAGTSNALPLIGSVIHPDIDDSQVDTTLSIGGIPEGNEYVTQSALYGSTEIDESFWDDQSNNVIAHTVTLHMADFPSGWQADNANIQQVKLLVDGSVDLQMATGDAAEYNANNTGKLSVSGLTDQQIASALQTQTDGLVDAVSGITYSQIEFRPGEDFRLLSPAPITGDDLTWLTTNSDGNQEFVPILSAAGTFSNNSPPSSLYALDSRDLIVGGSSSLNVYAAGDDTIFGGSGTETIQAATQATKIEYWGEGAAHIYDTTNENLHLGSGATTIYLQKGLQDPDISNVYNFDPSKDVIIPKGYTLSDLRQVVDPLSVWSIDAGDVSGAATEQDIQDALNQGFLSDGPDGYGYYPSPDPNAQPMYGTIPGTQTVGWYYWYSVDTPNTDNSFQFESGHNTINIVGDQPLLWTAFGYSGVNVDNMSGDMTVDGGSAGNLVDNGMSTSNLTVNETGGNDTIRAGTGDTTVTTGAGQSQIDLSAQASWALDMVNSGGADAITGGHGKLVASLNGGYIATQTDAQDTINLGSAGSSVYSLGQDVINGTTGNDTVTADGPATINGGTGQSFYTLQNDGLVLNSHGTDSVNADHGGTVTADGTSLYLEDVAEAQLTVQENAPGSLGTVTVADAAAYTYIPGYQSTQIIAGSGSGGLDVTAGIDGESFAFGDGSETLTSAYSGITITETTLSALQIEDSGVGTHVEGGANGFVYDGSQSQGSQTITTQVGATNSITLGSGSTMITSAGTDNIAVGAAFASITASGSFTVSEAGGSIHITETGASTASGTVSGGTATVTGTPGGLRINGSSASVTMSAGTGTVALSGGGSSITGGSGILSVMDAGSANIIVGGLGGLVLSASSNVGGEVVSTTEGSTNTITLGTGSDTLISAGTDTINVGAAAAVVTASGTFTITETTGSVQVTKTGGTAASATVSGGLVTITGAANSAGLNISTSATGVGTHITLGLGNDSVTTLGPTTLVGGSGLMVFTGHANAVVTDGLGGEQVQMGSGNTQFTTMAGTHNTLNLGSGTQVVNSAGNDSIYAGSGAVTVDGSIGAILIYASTGALTFQGGSGSSTVHGKTSSGGAMSILGGSGSMIVTGGSGNDTLVAGAGNMGFTEGNGAATAQFGSGHATVTGGTGVDVYSLISGSSTGSGVINGFKVGTDHLHLVGFGPSEAQNALANETVSGGSTTLGFTGGEHIILNGVTGLTAASFS